MTLRRLIRTLIHDLRPDAIPPTLASRDAYALWSAAYPPHAHNGLMRIEQDALLPLVPSLAGCDVLDLACGTGRYGWIALEAGAHSVVGIDDSLPMLRAGALHSILEGSMTHLPLPAAAFDVVISGMALGHLPPDAMRMAIAEVARVLRPGGTFVFSDFHPFVYLSGGRRTFTTGQGQQYAVEHHPHLIATYFDAIRAAGLLLTAIVEPLATVNDNEVPAVLIIRCQKAP